MRINERLDAEASTNGWWPRRNEPEGDFLGDASISSLLPGFEWSRLSHPVNQKLRSKLA